MSAKRVENLGRPITRRVHAQYLGFIQRLALGFGLPRAEVEDVMQEVLLDVEHSPLDPKLEDEKAIRAMLCVLTRWRVRKDQRRPYHHAQATDPAQLPALVASATSPEEHASHRQMLGLLDRWIDALPELLREVFVMVEFGGLSVPATAEALSIPVNTAKDRLRRARDEVEAAYAAACADAQGASASVLPLAALIERSRLPEPISDDVRARVWERFSRSLAEPDGSPPVEVPGRSPSGTATPSGGIGRSVALAGIGAVFGLTVGFALGRQSATSFPATPEHFAAPLAEMVTAAPLPAPAPSAPEEASSGVARTGERPPGDESRLGAESRLLNAAREAYGVRRFDLARAELQEHARTFPHGVQSTAREVLLFKLLLSEGRRTEAEARVARLRAESPQSPLVPVFDQLLNGAATP